MKVCNPEVTLAKDAEEIKGAQADDEAGINVARVCDNGAKALGGEGRVYVDGGKCPHIWDDIDATCGLDDTIVGKVNAVGSKISIYVSTSRGAVCESIKVCESRWTACD